MIKKKHPDNHEHSAAPEPQTTSLSERLRKTLKDETRFKPHGTTVFTLVKKVYDTDELKNSDLDQKVAETKQILDNADWARAENDRYFYSGPREKEKQVQPAAGEGETAVNAPVKTEEDVRLSQKYPATYEKIFSILGSNPHCVTIEDVEDILDNSYIDDDIDDPSVIKDILNNASWAKKSEMSLPLEADVDFECENKFKNLYAKMTPYIFVYHGNLLSPCDSWRKIYVTFVSALVHDYPDSFKPDMSFTGNGRKDLVSKEKSFLNKPRHVPGTDYILETCISAENILFKMKALLDRCGVGYSDVTIRCKYVPDVNNRTDPAESVAQEPTAEPGKSFNPERYKDILNNNFGGEFQLDSIIDTGKFRSIYKETYGTDLTEDDDRINSNIRNLCININGKAYLREKILHGDFAGGGRDSLIISYYLSRCNEKAVELLGYSNFSDAFAGISALLDENPNNIKNMRDEFDPYFDNGRRGWYQHKLRPSRQEVFDLMKNFDDDQAGQIAVNILEKYRREKTNGVPLPLKNLGELIKKSSEHYRQEYVWQDVTLADEFKDAYRAYLDSKDWEIEFLDSTAVITSPSSHNIYVPNQWFTIASYAVGVYDELKKYKDYFEKTAEALGEKKDDYARKLRDNPSSIDRNAFVTAAEKILSSDLHNKEGIQKSVDRLWRFLTDYSWWSGQKTVDRTDFYVSVILNMLNLVNVSQGYVADIVNAYGSDARLRELVGSLDTFTTNMDGTTYGLEIDDEEYETAENREDTHTQSATVEDGGVKTIYISKASIDRLGGRK